MDEASGVLRRRVFEEMFGARQLSVLELLRAISRYAQGQEYRFLDSEKFHSIVASDLMRGQRIYWQELIARSHFAATSSAIRHERWLDGCLGAVCDGNYLIFCSAFRGLLESAADSFEGLFRAPQCFAENRKRIKDILEGKDTGKEIFISREFEDSLIHFSHARKKIALEGGAPESHRAKQVREYMRIFEVGQLPNVIECYSELCEVAHPSALSVLAYVQSEKTSDTVIWRINADTDPEQIASFIKRYNSLMQELMMFVLNPLLLTLYALERLPSERPNCPEMANVDLSRIPAFRKFSGHLEDSE
ncbi:MAG: hypothetical protein ACRD33_07300 [Candidatus Acidiferrales bacterium]